MGLDAFFFSRLHYADKDKRLNNKTMEFVWRPMFDTLGESAQIFTHAFYEHYYPPAGFDFDNKWGPGDKFTPDNAASKAQQFHEHILEQSQHYTSNHILIPMGGDLHFQDAGTFFKYSQALIDYYNDNIGKQANIELIYSTPSMYVDAVNAEGLVYSTKYDDMFPYADNDQSYWTGFFSSRPNLKEYIRRAEQTLHASNKLFALTSLDKEISDDFPALAEAAKDKMMDVVGVVQHHDAATGTSKQRVANDYARLIYEQLQVTNQVYANAIEYWAKKTGFDASGWQWCTRTNSTYEDCPIASHGDDLKMLVAVHNPANLPMK